MHLVLHEPAKEVVLAWQPGDPIDRQARALVVPGVGLDFVEIVVSVTTGEIVEWQVVEGMRPALMFGETMIAIGAVKEHPDWQAAMLRRGITDFEHVQLDPWPAGNFGLPLEADRRISRVLSYLRESKTDNGYARPIEGVLVFFDMSAGKVIEVVDYGETPLPPERFELPARRRRRDAHRPAPDRDHATRGPELHRRGQPREVAALVAARRVRSVRRPHAAHDRLRRRRSGAPDPVPRR